MPLNEIPKHLRPETRRLIDAALEQAWQELKEDGPADVALARRKLAGTIILLLRLARPTRPSSSGSLCMPLEGMADSALEDASTSRGQQRSLRGGSFYAGRTQEHR